MSSQNIVPDFRSALIVIPGPLFTSDAAGILKVRSCSSNVGNSGHNSHLDLQDNKVKTRI